MELLDEAEQDMIDGYRFYEMKDQGLGDYFLNSLFSEIDSLRLYAGIHSVHFGYHRLLSKRFPFAVSYQVEQHTAQVWGGSGLPPGSKDRSPIVRFPNKRIERDFGLAAPLRAAANVFRQLTDCADVGLLSPCGVPPQLHIFNHALT